MKYFSDKTNKFYETEDECKNAEELFDSYKRQKSSLKKELSKRIEDANSKIDEAYKKYDEAKEEASKILKEAKEKAEGIIRDAETNINKYQQEKEKAVSEFNSKFGTYMVTYTGEDARNEYRRTLKMFDNLFNNFWRF